jgi:urease accessory protein
VAGMQRDSLAVRSGKPVLLTNCRSGEGIDAVIDRIAYDVLLVA